jgi:trk system potassium uptake protein
MRIVIAGCGRVGHQAALMLSAAGDDVSVVDRDPGAVDRLGRSFDGAFHVGLAYDVDALEEAGIREADAFLAVTDSDNANLMAVQLAKAVFGVPRAIARLDDPAREESYRALDVDFVAGAHLAAQVIADLVREPDFAYHTRFPTGDVQLIEMVVGDGAAGLSVRALEREGGVRVAAVRRGDATLLGADDVLVESGDVVVAAVKRGTEGKVRHLLGERGQAP